MLSLRDRIKNLVVVLYSDTPEVTSYVLILLPYECVNYVINIHNYVSLLPGIKWIFTAEYKFIVE